MVTPLFVASVNNHLEAAEMLCEHRADVNLANANPEARSRRLKQLRTTTVTVKAVPLRYSFLFFNCFSYVFEGLWVVFDFDKLFGGQGVRHLSVI